jgi:pilus assembly protein Flp/PilA
MAKLNQYINDESGASAAEYALILALIAGAIIVALNALGSAISGKLNSIAGTISSAS